VEQIMEIKVFRSKEGLAQAAASHAASLMREAISRRGNGRIIAATGASQFEFLDALIRIPAIDWSRVEMFHLDEYVGLPETHPASFRKYLRERLIQKTGIKKSHLLDGDGDIACVVDKVGRELNSAPIDIAFVGIGENGHLAFNDPPADFETESPYLVVDLDQACRQQQVNEGWFASVADVPRQAISMSVKQILKSHEILAVGGGVA
jgi:glucosamine-6-phosphate deaminase